MLFARLNSPVLRRRLALLALCAFVLQAAIPMGFMIGVIDGHARVVLCPAATPAHHMSAAQMAAGMAHRGAHAAGGSSCPFALAGGAALLSRPPAPTEPYYVYLQPVRSAAVVSLPLEPPPRHRAPRGPPALV